MSSNQPQVWFITGCSSGFGDALAREALSRGYKVIATARKVETLQSLKDVGADAMQLDVTAPLEELQSKAKEAYALYNRIDYLINNAGYLQMGAIEETTPSETLDIFNTNVFGLLNVTRAFLPYLRERRSGVVGNISSTNAWHPYPGQSMYGVSKKAVSGFSEVMSAELAEFGIKACAIEAGAFRSELLSPEKSKLPKNRIPAYDGTFARQVMEYIPGYHGKQQGDLEKGAKVIVDVLTRATGKEIPLRLALGPDVYAEIKNVCEQTLELLEEWKEVSHSTNRSDEHMTYEARS